MERDVQHLMSSVKGCQCPTTVSVIRQRRLALWKSVLTPFERVNDDPTIACRKTLMGKLSFEHRFPHQTARRTQLQEDISLCIISETKDQGIDTTGDKSVSERFTAQ